MSQFPEEKRFFCHYLSVLVDEIRFDLQEKRLDLQNKAQEIIFDPDLKVDVDKIEKGINLLEDGAKRIFWRHCDPEHEFIHGDE